MDFIDKKVEELIVKFGNKDAALMCVGEVLFCDAIFHAHNKETEEERIFWQQVRKRLLAKQ